MPVAGGRSRVADEKPDHDPARSGRRLTEVGKLPQEENEVDARGHNMPGLARSGPIEQAL